MQKPQRQAMLNPLEFDKSKYSGDLGGRRLS